MIEKLCAKWGSVRLLRTARHYGPWIVASLLLVIALGQADAAALAGLFQSPPTDTPTVPPTEPPTETPTLAVTPTLTPTATLTPTITPTWTPPPTETPELPPTLPAEPVQDPVVTATLPVDSGSAELDSAPVRNRYPDEDSNVEFEWGMLFDSMALGVSYIWLCCGVLLLLLLPLGFLAFWVAARRRRRRIE